MFGSSLVQHVGGGIVLPDTLQVKEKVDEILRKERHQTKRRRT